jgi:hypothetical protein
VEDLTLDAWADGFAGRMVNDLSFFSSPSHLILSSFLLFFLKLTSRLCYAVGKDVVQVGGLREKKRAIAMGREESSR